LGKRYENVLVVEFKQKGLPYKQQPLFPVFYKSFQVGEYITDLILYDKIIVDTKVRKSLGNNEKASIINYLKIT
jgi:GxxExxY protein